jgi:hypothetical protein
MKYLKRTNFRIARYQGILKVDCEGFDTIIIRGATGLLVAEMHRHYSFEYNKTNMEAIVEDGLGTLLIPRKIWLPFGDFF